MRIPFHLINVAHALPKLKFAGYELTKTSLRSTTIDLVRRKINTSVKGRKSSAPPQNRSPTRSEEPPAPPIKCPANASGKNGHRDAASFAKYGICWFDTKDDKIGHNGGPSFEEVVVGFYDRTDGGTKTDRVEPTVFDVDVKTNPIPAECLSCITEDRAYLLQITWSRFNEGEMRKRVSKRLLEEKSLHN